MQGEPTLLQKGFTLRDATKADLDDMTEIHIQGFTEEPQVHYCYPRRKRFPYDHDEWTRTEYYRYLQQPNKFQVHVLEASIESKGKIVVVPVALAVWNTAVLEQAIEPDPEVYWGKKHRNKKHCDVFSEAAGKRFGTYFAEWAEKQMNLSTLVVHPDFRRRGGGTLLVNWGIKAAEEKGWPVTLCASPIGRPFYEQLGFKRIADEVVRVEGEEESLTSTAMVYDPSAMRTPDDGGTQ